VAEQEQADVTDDHLLDVRNLTVSFGPRGRRPAPVVDGVSLSISAGECLALVGESGSGKSVTARTLIGLAGSDARVTADRLQFGERDLLRLNESQWRRVRGQHIGFVLQDALVSLDPLRTIGREIDDSLRLHTTMTRTQRRQRVLQLLDDVGIPDPELRSRQRAGELSGGMRQRALIAAAIALEPALIIADEPTTALDVSIQSQILGVLADLTSRGTAVLMISHDLSVVRNIADRVAVMRRGEIVESGTTQQALEQPRHEYTMALIRAVPAAHPRGQRLTTGERPTAVGPGSAASAAPVEPVLELTGVTKHFDTGAHASFTAVDDVSLTVHAGKTLGMVGASGSGKTTTARIALGLTRPDAGSVRLLGSPWVPLSEAQRRDRRSIIGAIYQDPFSSFDPRWSVGRLLADALTGGRSTRPGAHTERIAELLQSVGLDPSLTNRRTRSLSGGQRQRVAIARAIAPQPRVIICDEPVSSLDVSVQAQVLDLLDELQETLGLGYLFISHDLGVIRHISDTVVVMSDGRIVDAGHTGRVLDASESLVHRPSDNMDSSHIQAP
jgi:peptide/nickel transport system ATP-binding protein